MVTKTQETGRVRRIKAVTRETKAGKFFAIVEGARPVRGSRLYAHTYAALTFLGMLAGQTALRKAVETLIGKHATSYHLSNKNFGETGAHLKLTSKGKKSFAAREASGKFDAGMADAYLAAITKGKASAEYGIERSHLYPVTDCPVR